MDRDLKKLHKKYCISLFPERFVELIWTHSKIVFDIANTIANNLENNNNIYVNKDLLKQGCLLHDIGVYKCRFEDFNIGNKLLPYLHHGFTGAEIIKKEGFSTSIQRFALTHTGTGLTKEDILRENLPFEVKDYIPISIEEEILCFADKFHTKSPAFSNYETEVNKLKKFDSTREVKMDNFKRKYGLPDLTALKKKYDPWNLEFETWLDTIC